jgi:hypothetical protein
MRDNLTADARDSDLMAALTGTEVALVADNTLAEYASQVAYVTAALLMGRSGAMVHLIGPSVPLVGPHPPLQEGGVVEALMSFDRELMPTPRFAAGIPLREVDLQILVGGANPAVRARRTVVIGASPWESSICDYAGSDAVVGEWPIGPMGAGGLAAIEAFKSAMAKLRRYASDTRFFDEQFAPTKLHRATFAPASTPLCSELGPIDVVSAGAITNALLYVLTRIPGIRVSLRILDDDRIELSNANRYLLMPLSSIRSRKTKVLQDVCSANVRVLGVPHRFVGESQNGSLGSVVVVGSDDIPTRWSVQAAQPKWLCVGATSHWCAMASFHVQGIGCAGCLHPRDEPANGPIPTISVVSFWAGLLVANYLLRRAGGVPASIEEQHSYVCPLRPESRWTAPVAISAACPLGH